MRRIIHNTTAIAAGLALLLPQVAAAEMRISDDIANAEAQPRAEAMPFLAGVLQAEMDAGLTVDGLVCLNGDARPCADDVPLATPEGVVVEVAESDAIVLAPVNQQVNRADADGNVIPRDAAQAAEAAPTEEEAVAELETALAGDDANAEAESVAEAAPETAEAEPEMAEAEVTAEAEEPATALDQAAAEAQQDLGAAAEPAEAEATAEADIQEPEAEAETTAEADVQEPEAEAEAEAETNAEADVQEPEAEAEAQVETATEADTADEDALAEALANAQEPAAEPEQAEAETAGGLTMANGETARERISEMPGLASVLRQELDAGLTHDQLICQTGEAAPCAQGVALMTPRGVGVIVNDNDSVALLPSGRQINRVNANGEILPRAPEEDTVETAASKEAAEEAEAPVATALDAADGAGETVDEQEITEANSRSSADDFEASLRGALEQAGQLTGATNDQQQANAAADDGGDNDLAKALILGLGAVAVGQMLNNNRQVALSTDDRVVVTRADGSQEVIKDEVALLRQPGSTVTTENFDDGSSRTIVTREDGSKVVTIRDADLRVLRRTLISTDGTSTMLIDDTADVRPVDVASLPAPAEAQTSDGAMSEDELRAALQRESVIDRRFTLGQVRNIPEVRALVAPVNIDAITFDTGSAAINPDQARQLSGLGSVIQDAIANNPREIFMIEGHTDTVGADAMNLALSDRRAESVALALTEYFDVPPENMVVQGYGEQFLKVRSEGDIRDNRRASVRRITDLLQTAQAN
ncbi:OmpA family protein [Paracoccus tegillarcae]|uniref:Flagellar motor protein MotB n=1 Tax=Paracoccus tegillarcae TaxID=1529068 RepID=A0A2K9EHR3_9RHOB|nr:OmpA family protein [Paracoccus tegillarcae]AUH33879.1 flagellar motor protein MotB [Paracoccus tegillarcae]